MLYCRSSPLQTSPPPGNDLGKALQWGKVCNGFSAPLQIFLGEGLQWGGEVCNITPVCKNVCPDAPRNHRDVIFPDIEDRVGLRPWPTSTRYGLHGPEKTSSKALKCIIIQIDIKVYNDLCFIIQ